MDPSRLKNVESSILEQLRLQEGHLFQNEHVLALFLDVKTIMLDNIGLVETEALAETLEAGLKKLGPTGIDDFHEKSLNECIKTVSKLLWPTELLSLAKARTFKLMQGMCRRLSSQNTDAFRGLDPIQQDFVVREAFRRTLVNDCLVVFEGPQELPDLPELPELPRPAGARSCINGEDFRSASEESFHASAAPSATSSVHDAPIHDSKSVAPSVAKSVARSVAPSVAKSVAKSVAPSVAPSLAKSVAPSVAPSLALDAKSVAPKPSIISEIPRVVTVQKDAASSVSKATGLSESLSVMRKPFNIRRVHVEE